MTDDIEIEMSPLCRLFESDGIEVHVEIYRIPAEKWTLEVVDSTGTSIIWGGTFDTDDLALEEFRKDVREEGLRKIVEGDE